MCLNLRSMLRTGSNHAVIRKNIPISGYGKLKIMNWL